MKSKSFAFVVIVVAANCAAMFPGYQDERNPFTQEAQVVDQIIYRKVVPNLPPSSLYTYRHSYSFPQVYPLPRNDSPPPGGRGYYCPSRGCFSPSSHHQSNYRSCRYSPPPSYYDIEDRPIGNYYDLEDRPIGNKSERRRPQFIPHNLEIQHTQLAYPKKQNTLQNMSLFELCQRARDNKKNINMCFLDLFSDLDKVTKEQIIWALSHEEEETLDHLYYQMNQWRDYDIRVNTPMLIEDLNKSLKLAVNGENPFAAAKTLKDFFKQLVSDSRKKQSYKSEPETLIK